MAGRQTMPFFKRLFSAGVITMIGLGATSFSQPALALTEPKKPPLVDQQPADDQAEPGLDDAIDSPSDSTGVPMPDPLVKKPGDTVTDPSVTGPADIEKQAPVEVLRDISKAPDAVRKMRELIVEGAASGDIERLRDLLKTSTGHTQVTFGDDGTEDPVATLKGLSGDPDGREILAILLDIMSTGFVHVGVGTEDEAYVWPYFAEKQLDTLSPPEVVDLLRIVTAGDLADMKEYGSYNFYRVGISPNGEWKFFIAGD